MSDPVEALRVSVPRLSVPATISTVCGSRDVTALIDTGADVDLVVGDALCRILDAPTAGTAVLHESAVGQRFPVEKVWVTLHIGDFRTELQALVLPGLGEAACLIGLPLVKRLRGRPELEAAFTEVLGHGSGLTLTFDTRLHRFDPTAFDAFIAQVLGPDTDVTIEGRSNIDVDGPSFIRINGSRPEDLVAVAEAFYDRAWRDTEVEVEKRAMQKAMSTGLDILLHRLDHQRDHLTRIEETVGILDNPDVREKLEDEGAAYVLDKDRKALQTRFQRITTGIALEAPKKLLATVIGESAAGAVGEGVGEVIGGAAGAGAASAVDEVVGGEQG